MRIEALKTTPDRVGRYWVTFSDGNRMGLYRQTVEDFGLYPGLELDEGEYARLVESAGRMSARMRAVRIVSASSVSRRDLQQRLVRKGEDPEQARQAVEWMEEMHLMDDAATAEQIVSSCIRKGYGIQRARQALYEKKIPKDLWEDALADYPDMTDKLTEFLWSRLAGSTDEKAVRRAIDAALRRGYRYPQIRAALRKLNADNENYPEEW